MKEKTNPIKINLQLFAEPQTPTETSSGTQQTQTQPQEPTTTMTSTQTPAETPPDTQQTQTSPQEPDFATKLKTKINENINFLKSLGYDVSKIAETTQSTSAQAETETPSEKNKENKTTDLSNLTKQLNQQTNKNSLMAQLMIQGKGQSGMAILEAFPDFIPSDKTLSQEEIKAKIEALSPYLATSDDKTKQQPYIPTDKTPKPNPTEPQKTDKENIAFVKSIVSKYVSDEKEKEKYENTIKNYI